MTMDRKNIIGSSDIAAVLGLSRWQTPLELWARKTGKVPEENLDEKEYVEWGKRLEGVVAEKFADENNVKLMAYKKRFTHPVYPFLSCELDRIITGTDEMVEVKTCTGWKAKEWEGEDIPTEYILQVNFALGISGRKIGHVAVLIGGNTYKQKKVEFDPGLFDVMVKKAVEFMEKVKNDEPPIALAGDKQILSELYPGDPDQEYTPSESQAKTIDELMEERMALKRTVDEALKQVESLENHVKELMQEASVLKTGNYSITWKGQVKRSLDTDKIKADGLYDQYSKESVSRVFRVSKAKKAGIK